MSSTQVYKVYIKATPPQGQHAIHPMYLPAMTA